MPADLKTHTRAGLLVICSAVLMLAACLGASGPVQGQSTDELLALCRRSISMAQAGKFDDALPLARRCLAGTTARYGEEDAKAAFALDALASVLEDGFARHDESEALRRRALQVAEKAFGPDDRRLATYLNNFAILLRNTNRPEEAEPLYRRALALAEKNFGPEDPKVATYLSNLALTLKVMDRFEEAEPLLRRAVDIGEKAFGPDHPSMAVKLNNLARLLDDRRQFAEAEPLMRRALAIEEKSLGGDHPRIAQALNNLALLLSHTNRPQEAEALYRRALAISEKFLGRQHPTVALELSNLALVRAEQGDWAEAAAIGRQAVPILTRNGSAAPGGSSSAEKALLSERTWQFRGHARAIYRADPDSASGLEEGFILAQWAMQTSAADALAQMSARFATSGGALGQSVRMRQDLVKRRQAEDRALLAAVGRGDAAAADKARAGIAAIEHQLEAIDLELASSAKPYLELVAPAPLTVAGARKLLRDDEVLVVILDLPQYGAVPEETVVWAVSKDTSRWYHIPLGPDAWSAQVAALRCGLDHTVWDEGEGHEGAATCSRLLHTLPSTQQIEGKIETVLPFDLARAHSLYQSLLGPIEDLISGRHLLIVASAPLTTLPFSVLVTQSPQAAVPNELSVYRSAAWLGRRQPITVLPSVTSLRALREFARASHAAKPYLGIGNPLLDGDQDDPQWGSFYRAQAVAARDRQRCSKSQFAQVAPAPASRSGFVRLFRGAHADARELRRLAPLPDTADELCEVGSRLNASEAHDILLGARATEGRLKDLSERGELAQYAILHFATHGALTGQVPGSAEPGLILTPPLGTGEAPASLARDDGYLTASEIAMLRLDADWVVLSACNTAGAQNERAEPLSGMAQAFFYAGARALLVSHWEVGSEAAVHLITRTFAHLQAKPQIGRAEAYRLAMRDLVEKGSLVEAHPSQWAPFALVGEGAR